MFHDVLGLLWLITHHQLLHLACDQVPLSSSNSFHWPAHSEGFIFPSCNKEVKALAGVQHLSGSLGTSDGSQFVAVKARVQGHARPTCFLPLSPRCEHVAHLAVEMRVGGKAVEYQILNPFDGVPEQEKKNNKKQTSFNFLCKPTVFNIRFEKATPNKLKGNNTGFLFTNQVSGLI